MSRSVLRYFTPAPIDPDLPHPFWILSSTLTLTSITSLSFALPLLASALRAFFRSFNILGLFFFLVFPILLALAWLIWSAAILNWLHRNRAPRKAFSIFFLLLIPLTLSFFLIPLAHTCINRLP